MPIAVHISADTVEEYMEALSVLSRGLQAGTNRVNTVNIPGATSSGAVPGVPPSATEDVTAEIVAKAGAVDTVEEAPKRTRGRPKKDEAQAPAAEDPFSAKAEAKPVAAPPADDPFGAAEEVKAATPAKPARDPAVDKGLAMELLRNVYDRPGMVAKVSGLMREFNVNKFTAVPDDEGTKLLEAAQKLDRENPAPSTAE